MKLFSNIELLLGINEELCKRLRDVTKKYEEKHKRKRESMKQMKLLNLNTKAFVRIKLEKDQTFKTIVITAATTGEQAIDLLMKKALRGMTADEQVLWANKYSKGELVNIATGFYYLIMHCTF